MDVTDRANAHRPLEGLALLADSERIAKRLHNCSIQSLFSIGMGLRATRGIVDDPEAVSLCVGAAADEIDRIARQLRSYLCLLRPGLISGWELERELRALARQLEVGQNISMAVEIDSLAASTLAASSRSEDVVHAAREAVASTLCHSVSKRVVLSLFLVNGAAMLEIRGEGRWLDSDNVMGIRDDFSTLRARASALRAALEIESHRGEETRVRVRIPVLDETGEGLMPDGGGRGIRVVVVHEHEIVREGLRALIGPADDIVVCGEAGSVADALRVAEWTRPDIVVMDVHLADGSGIEATRTLRAHHPATRVLLLASFGDDEALFSSIMAGAAGFVLKEIKGDHLVEAIRCVAAGRNLLDPAVTGRVFERVRQAGTPLPDEKLSRLSPQEKRILSLVAKGNSNREIALALHLAEKTVKNYVSGILSKLEVTRRAEAAAYVSRPF